MFPADIHTHHIDRRDNAVVSGTPDEVAQWAALYPEAQFSVGIHPWQTASLASDPAALEAELHKLREIATHPQVTIIGETGLDAMRGASLPMQQKILQEHIDLAERLHKPLLLHVVKRFNEILALRHDLAPTLSQPWIFHGFRGKPQLARRLLASATEASPVYISLGEHFNPETACIIPASNLLLETDESPLAISEIARRVDAARGGRAI